MYDEYMIVYVTGAVIGGLIWGSVCIGIIRSKGYEAAPFTSWFWVGFFLGIIGVIIAAVKPEASSSNNRQ